MFDNEFIIPVYFNSAWDITPYLERISIRVQNEKKCQLKVIVCIHLFSILNISQARLPHFGFKLFHWNIEEKGELLLKISQTTVS